MVNRIPFINWCKHCVSWRGISDPHARQTYLGEQEVPVISIDYVFMGESAGAEAREQLQPIIVLKDRRSKTIKAHVLWLVRHAA